MLNELQVIVGKGLECGTNLHLRSNLMVQTKQFVVIVSNH